MKRLPVLFVGLLVGFVAATTVPVYAQHPSAETAASSLPSAWVTPQVLDFGPVGVGVTSAIQTVTITNTGSATLTNFTGGAPFDTQFGASQNCAGGVASGASCQYFFTFKPTAVGDATTTSTTSTNAGPFTIILRGSGVGPKVIVTPRLLDFGELTPGSTSAIQTVTITNTGSATLTNFTGGAPSDAQFGASQNCAGGVAPGASCQYFFTFKPTATGVFSTTSNTSSNAGPLIVGLQGTAASLLTSKLWVTPLELDFGPVGVGLTSAPQTVKITNTGLATLTNFIGGVPFDSQFGASQNCAGGVAPGATCEYFFTFKPTTLGRVSTTSNTSTNAGPFVIQMFGGVAAPETSMAFAPVRLDVGAQATLSYTLTNANTSLAATGVGFTNPLPAGLRLATPSNPTASADCNTPSITAAAGGTTVVVTNGTLGGGKTCVISVQVEAVTPGNWVNAVAASSGNGGTGNATTATVAVAYYLHLPLAGR